MSEKPVSLREVVDALDSSSDTLVAFIDPDTGTVDVLPETADLAEFGLVEERLVFLPSQFDLDDHRMMRGFARSLVDRKARDELTAALSRRGAYRRFRETVHRLGLFDAWCDERQARLAEIAIEYLESERIAFENDLPLPGSRESP